MTPQIFSRKLKQSWQNIGYLVLHIKDPFDLVAVHEGHGAVILAQAKVVATMAQAKRLVRDWVPALKSNDNYLQLLTIWVREERTVVDTWA